MDSDVIVVGSGPVGLMLAAELRLAGARPLVVERLAEPATERRARGIGPLAAEALRRRGLGPTIAPFHEAAHEQLRRDHGSEYQHFAWIWKIDPESQEDPDRRPALIWQPDLVRVLTEYVAGLGVTVHRGHELIALAQDRDGVTATVRTPEGEIALSARYLVGCDGGRSTVRKLAGFDFPGTGPTMIGRGGVGRIEDVSELPPPGRIPTGALFYGSGHGMIGTFEFAVTGTADFGDGPTTGTDLAASIHRLTGVRVTVSELTDPIRATDNARQASTYRLGRVLLAGDAAHVHSPNGGQGLNLGIMDAVNLGWKLAATALGTAPDGLLDTYPAERHPVGAAVLHNTRAQSALLQPGPHVDALRDIVSDLMDVPEVNRYFGRLVNALDTRYDLGYPSTDGHPLLGTHCPDLAVRTASGPTVLSALTTTGGGVLLYPPDGPSIAPGGVNVVAVTGIERDLAAALIRPDGVLAWAATEGEPIDTGTLDTALSRWFG